MADAILITVPERFWDEYPGGKDAFDKVMDFVSQGRCLWHQTISNIPKQNVEFVYLVIHGKIALRLTIHEYMKNTSLTFKDGGVDRSFGNKNWVVLTGPVEKAPREMIRKGFQGFRYTEFLF